MSTLLMKHIIYVKAAQFQSS